MGWSLPGLIEIAQIWRRLALLGRHQGAVGGQHVVLLADLDVIVVLAAIVVAPGGPLLVWLAAVGLVDRPRTRQGMVDHRDVAMQAVGICLLDMNSLFHD